MSGVVFFLQARPRRNQLRRLFKVLGLGSLTRNSLKLFLVTLTTALLLCHGLEVGQQFCGVHFSRHLRDALSATSPECPKTFHRICDEVISDKRLRNPPPQKTPALGWCIHFPTLCLRTDKVVSPKVATWRAAAHSASKSPNLLLRPCRVYRAVICCHLFYCLLWFSGFGPAAHPFEALFRWVAKSPSEQQVVDLKRSANVHVQLLDPARPLLERWGRWCQRAEQAFSSAPFLLKPALRREEDKAARQARSERCSLFTQFQNETWHASCAC